ncbi:hypothetical protein VOLCADRAFT_98484 [Volvox carteri f. nagariensis]|uniref:Uncharacterized protein n=1 Tax=Volvox carteri f. nagariensis TaxID=3068 RepID=D8UFG4_VOLCA|nr:uncharacterized protein VOLCADRAFT_98484 [Volvox carteri f. nagariensis]EFJ41454.1 hypothetical protein VOLCADRAFT_98484 [Volvox carteri f. nagariensis]|eukprot:XP_002957399.1 hypothetical protein VOLCADRAFT_98484 [Volvox carteri f. nagariensis]
MAGKPTQELGGGTILAGHRRRGKGPKEHLVGRGQTPLSAPARRAIERDGEEMNPPDRPETSKHATQLQPPTTKTTPPAAQLTQTTAAQREQAENGDLQSREGGSGGSGGAPS